MKIWLLIHRYLGIAVGILMVMWCVTGIVMMYVPYPFLSEGQRVEHLGRIDWKACCTLPRTGAWIGFDVETVGARTLLRIKDEQGRVGLFDLANGAAIGSIGEADAAAVAAEFAAGRRRGSLAAAPLVGPAPSAGPAPALAVARRPTPPRLLGVIDHDQWTVQGAHGRDRPLFHFALDDAAGTEVYVSSVTGKALQLTTSRQRFWNWLGAIPHWLYFSTLRQHPAAWTQLVVWTSLLGTFLTLTGLYIGIRHLRVRRGVRWTPYRGLHYWHHLLGLACGLFLLTWVFSGLVSMNPWGFLEGGMGPPPQPLTSTITIPRGAKGWTSLRAAPIGGRLFVIATGTDGSRIRLDAAGSVASLTHAELTSVADGHRIKSTELITTEDEYYFSHHREQVSLPAYRMILDDSAQTRYYLDPVSGQLLSLIDSNGRWYRWLHQALHRIDFSAAVRASPTRDVFMVTALVGMAVASALGTYLGLRR